MDRPNKKQRFLRLFSVLLSLSLALGLLGAALADEARMIGLTVSDELLIGGDAQEIAVAEPLEIVTTGADGGIGVYVFTKNDPVSVTITGGVAVHDQSETGFEAMGVRALAYPGGDVALTIDGDVSVKAESQSEEAAAYGIQIGTDGALRSNYYEDENGARLAVHSSLYAALPPTVTRDGVNVTEEFADLYAFFAKEAEGWALYLVTAEGEIRCFSRDVTEEDAKLFAGYIAGPGQVIQGPITVTLHTDENDAGDTVTLDLLSGTGMGVAVDALEHYFLALKDGRIIDPVTGKTHALGVFDTPQARADVSGFLRAEASADAIGLDVKTDAGPVDVTLRSGTAVESRGAVAAGVYVSTTKTGTVLRGEDVTIRAEGLPGERSEALGIWLVTTSAEGSHLALTGNNRIEAATSGTPQRYAAGILSSGGVRGVSELYYEGDIDVSGTGMIGVQVIASQGANVSVHVIGNVNLSDSDRDGLYVQLAGAMPALNFVPQGEIFLRGSVNVTNARDDAAGVSAIGGVVVVDGDVSVSGEGDLYGVYADESATVLVTGEIDAPIAVLIPSDSDTVQNDSNVYVWNYDETSLGKTERIGFVLKLGEGVEAELESESEAFLSLTLEGKTYYGAKGGDIVTVKTRQTGLLVLDAAGNALPTEPTDGGFRFTVPAGCGATITAP